MVLPKAFIASETGLSKTDKTRGLAVSHGTSPTPFGMGVFLWTDQGLVGLGFADKGDEETVHDDLAARFGAADFDRDDAQARIWADDIFSPSPKSVPLVLYGSFWQCRVWRALLSLKAGETLSYGALAARLDAPKAARAVGAAVGANSLAWLIPCHRVLGADGHLHGYRWGLQCKRAMLAHEGIQAGLS